MSIAHTVPVVNRLKAGREVVRDDSIVDFIADCPRVKVGEYGEVTAGSSTDA